MNQYTKPIYNYLLKDSCYVMMSNGETGIQTDAYCLPTLYCIAAHQTPRLTDLQTYRLTVSIIRERRS
jgi:hypothetical protein